MREKYLCLNGKGFTLIELLTVCAIIAILSAILIPALGAARSKAKVGAAKSNISSLAAAIAQYAVDFGTYPPDDGPGENAGCDTLMDRLCNDTAYGNNLQWEGPYLSLRDSHFEDGSFPNISWEDPWGNAYNYRYNVSGTGIKGYSRGLQYNLWSRGPNGVDDSYDSNTDYSDDIYNW